MMQQKLVQTGATAVIKPASGSQVRNKFLNMIGIERASGASEPSAPKKGSTAQSPPSSTKWVNPRSQAASVTPTLKEMLKYDRVADQKYSSPKRRKTERSSVGRRGKALMFNETVEVVPIPMRTEYSNRVRSRIWSNATEIQENATRNTIEFASEGWDWRSVKEDEHMYRCMATNELLHPCWVSPAKHETASRSPPPKARS